jgi:hypothetical protein
MKPPGAGLAFATASVLTLAIIASFLGKKPRDDSIAVPSPVPAPVPLADTSGGIPRDHRIPTEPPPGPAPGVLDTGTVGAARARADALHEDERWLEAGNAYLDVLASFPEHPEADEILERAFESYEWIESERQVEVLEEIFRRFPSRRTPVRALEHAVLKGIHGDLASAIPSAELALSALPEDAFRVYALRRVAGLHRAAGDRRREEVFLVESRALASALGDERTAAEIDRLLSGSAARE